MRLGVRLLPSAVREEEVEGRVAVVIDVIRFSTSVLAALEAGAAEVRTAPSPGEAARLADGLGRSEVLLCGEVGGKPIEGWDLGNSPRELASGRVAGRTLVYSTTNGTRALERVRGAERVLVACFRNLGAVARRVRELGAPALLVCAGRDDRVGLDDAWCAGLLADRLAEEEARPELDDGARVAVAASRSLGTPDRDALAATGAGAALVRIGYGGDLDVCAEMDRTGAVPVLGESGLVLEGAAA
ncbi:MAG TPA: 2-phosphosulfolactate phosphatase [Gemmatimonadota bacterium]|nr:2-phosphosulfolactate phosphatase [Gemmatimonadota bacterium]